MRKIARLLLTLLAVALPAAARAETAKAFVEHIYARYSHGDFNPLDRLDRYFAPPLAGEIRTDSAGGEVGYLDGDPLCDCQDVSGLKPRIEKVRMRDARNADARILLDFGTVDARTVSLRLVLTKSGWRVADVATKEEPSLLAALRSSKRKP